MNPIWTISINGGAYATLDSLGIVSASRRLASMSADSLSLGIAAPADSTAIIPHNAIVRLKRGTVKWFEGTNISNPRSASARSESIDHTIAGPWYQLEQTAYLQEWAMGRGTYFDRVRKPHVMLGYGISWTPAITGNTYTGDTTSTSTPTAVYVTIVDAIQDILAYAAANGVAIAWDLSGVPAIRIPATEDRDTSCAACIAKMLRWAPDVVGFFDYSTELPTLRFQRRGSLPAISLQVGSQLLSEWEFTERFDLQVPYVRMHYERADQINGATYPVDITQIHPPTATGREPGGLAGSIDLLGYQTSSTGVQTITVEPLSNLSTYFWNQRFPAHYNGIKGRIISFDSLAYDPPHNFPRVLTKGSIYPWMNLGAVATTAICRAYVETVDDQGHVTRRYERLSAKIIATNAPEGTNEYSTVADYLQGEDIPTGPGGITLSQWLYESLATLQYSGSVVLLEEECGDRDPNLTNLVGTCLNVTGSDQSAWASMRAMVQTVDEDLLLGQTRITVGPPEHLSPQDLKALQSISRERIKYHNAAAVAGESLAAGTLDLSAKEDKDVGKTGCINGWERFAVSHPTGGSAKIIPVQDGGSYFGMEWQWNTANPAAGVVKPAPEGAQTNTGKVFLNTNACVQEVTSGTPQTTTYIFHEVALRSLPFCMKDGTELTITVLCSKPYSPSGAEHDPFEEETTI